MPGFTFGDFPPWPWFFSKEGKNMELNEGREFNLKHPLLKIYCVCKIFKCFRNLMLTKAAFTTLVFFQLLTSFCPICSHIFKTLNAISITSVCCDHIINTICVVFSQYAVNYHVSKMLTFSFHTSLPKTNIMDLFSLIYKCLNTACQKWRPNVPNIKYSIKLLLLKQQQLRCFEKYLYIKYCNNW